jgi:hypothetical protein
MRQLADRSVHLCFASESQPTQVVSGSDGKEKEEETMNNRCYDLFALCMR